MNYPILIGSHALCHHKLVSDFKDIDLIVTDAIAKDLLMACDKKEHGFLWFTASKILLNYI